MFDVDKWKARLENNIVSLDMINNLYIKQKITLEDYLYITGLEETDLVQTQDPSQMEVLKEEVIALEKENKLLKAQVEALSQTSDFHEELIVEMANKVYA